MITIDWIDDKGAKHQHVQKDLYLTGESELINITIHADSTVTVKHHGLSFF